MQSDRFVESKRGLVIRPHVERYVVAFALLGVFNHIVIKRLADALTADVFVHAQVVDIKRFHVSQNIVVLVLNENAECVSENLAVAFGNEDRTGIIRKNNVKFGVCILFCSAFEKLKNEEKKG